jgi:hypothetical protein
MRLHDKDEFVNAVKRIIVVYSEKRMEHKNIKYRGSEC